MAFGMIGAWIALGAWILAHLIDAGQSGGTFSVTGTFGFLCDRLDEAIDEWIANIAGWARANGSMIFHSTFGRTIAWIAIFTRVDAIAILTRFHRAAIIVLRATGIFQRF